MLFGASTELVEVSRLLKEVYPELVEGSEPFMRKFSMVNYFPNFKIWYHLRMVNKVPRVSIAVLIINENKVLLGQLNKKWSKNGEQTYGIPGTDIQFGEKIGDVVNRNIREEFGCQTLDYKIISVNANYELGNHYIVIGVLTKIKGEINLLKPEDWEKWEWFEINKLPKNLFAAAKQTIESYISKKVCSSE